MVVDPAILDDLTQRLQRLEKQVALLSEAPPPSDCYSIAEFALRVGRSLYTVREWARLGRVSAERRATGSGPYREWVIRHAELLRYRESGLLPIQISNRSFTESDCDV